MNKFEAEVSVLVRELGLDCREQFRMGRRKWGAERRVDLLVTETATRRRIGIECKFQNGSGSADEKIFATIEDIKAWPIPGIVVLGGAGFSESMERYLVGSGAAVLFEDLDQWLRLFFRLDL